jgi:hypothetical protein
MQHVYANGAAGAPLVVPHSGAALPFTSIVYVNGVAVSANNDSNPASQATAGPRAGLLTVGAIEAAGSTGGALQFTNHYTGVIDDLSIYVYGDNTALGGQNWGAFDLFEDNDWIAAQIDALPGGQLVMGDVNRNGSVGDEDIAAFAANWRRENRLVGAHSQLTVGDWATWGWGDLDHSGVVDFHDWYLLRSAHPDGPNLSLAAALAGAYAVPEPSSAAIMLITAVTPFALRRRTLAKPRR